MNTFPGLIDTLKLFAGACESRYEDTTVPPTAEDLALLLDAVRGCRGALAEFYSEIEKALISEMGEKVLPVEGLGPVEAMKSTRRTKWQHEEIISRVVARLADEPGVFFSEEDGALLPFATIGHNIARGLNACISFGAGKVTGLKAMGLAPDEFCTEDAAVWKVKLPKVEI